MRAPKPKFAKGSSLVEALAVMAVTTLAFTLSLQCVSMGAARLWLDEALDRAARCQLSGAGHCRAHFERQARLLPWGEVRALQLQSDFNRRFYKTARAEMVWCNEKGGHTCQPEHTLRFAFVVSEKDFARGRPQALR